MRQLARKVALRPWSKLTIYEKNFGDITNPRPARSGIFLRCMKLAIYRFGVVLFIAVLLPRAMPAGQHEIKRAAPTTDSNNPALQPKIEQQDQMQVQEQRQDGEAVIRFIRDPDPATGFAVGGSGGER